MHGTDGRVMLTVDLEEDRKPLEKADGKVDYKDLVRLRNVLKGKLIAKIIPAQPGKLGMTVTGDELAFKAGKEAHLKSGKMYSLIMMALRCMQRLMGWSR